MVKGVLRTEAGTILDGPAYEPTIEGRRKDSFSRTILATGLEVIAKTQ